MSWKEKSPGRFERPLNSIERLFKTVGEAGGTFNREQWAVKACAKFRCVFSVTDTETALKNAWRTLRFLQPQMAAYIEGDCMIYNAPQNTDLESWMTETFVVEKALTIDELLASSRRSLLPTLYYLSKSSEILLSSSHWRIDAIGASSVLNLLFTFLAEPSQLSFNDESKNLSPGRDEAASLPQDLSQKNGNAATSLLMNYVTNLPSLGLPNLPSLDLPVELVNEVSGAFCRIETKLPTVTTTSIVAACKEKDFTITTVVHAALVVALQEVNSCTSSGERYTSWGTFNYRPYLNPGYTNPTMNAFTVMLCGLPISFITSSFHENASALKPFYAQLRDPFNNASLRVILEPYTKKQVAMMSQRLPPGMPQPTDPLMVSVGILDPYLHHIYGQGIVEVTEYWLGIVALTRQPLFYVWTWQGNMTLCMCFNDQFYTKKFMRSFLDRVVGILLEELAIERH